MHANQASYEDLEVHGLDPMAAPSQRAWDMRRHGVSSRSSRRCRPSSCWPSRRRSLGKRPPPMQAAGWSTGADLGRRRRHGRVCHAALRGGRRPLRGRGFERREGRAGQAPGRRGLHRQDGVRRHDAHRRGDPRGGGGGGGALRRLARVRQAREADPRGCPRHRLRARREGDVPDFGSNGQVLRQGRHLRSHQRLQPRLRRALPVDEAEESSARTSPTPTTA